MNSVNFILNIELLHNIFLYVALKNYSIKSNDLILFVQDTFYEARVFSN